MTRERGTREGEGKRTRTSVLFLRMFNSVMIAVYSYHCLDQ